MGNEVMFFFPRQWLRTFLLSVLLWVREVLELLENTLEEGKEVDRSIKC